jgi:hypothetical protein
MAAGTCLGSDQNLCGSPGASCSSCNDPDCTYGDCGTAGAAGSTVTPNPSVSPSATATSASQLSQLGNVMGQWGATIASIATGTPTVVTASGAKVGTTAVAPVSSNTTLLLLGAVVIVVIVLAMKK